MAKFSAKTFPFLIHSTTVLKAVVKDENIIPDRIHIRIKHSLMILKEIDEPLVSSAIIGINYGSLFDVTQTLVTKKEDGLYKVQIVAWYDDENSFTSYIIRINKYFLS